jgi:putative DNA primase/helicase
VSLTEDTLRKSRLAPTPTGDPVVDGAVACGQVGVYVFPARWTYDTASGKKVDEHFHRWWNKDTPRTPAHLGGVAIRKAFSSGRWNAYGIDMGASGLAGIDLDGPEAVDKFAALCAEHGDDPQADGAHIKHTPRDGGMHVVFRNDPQHPIGNGAGVVAPQIDHRGVGGLLYGTGSYDERGPYTGPEMPRPSTLPVIYPWLRDLANGGRKAVAEAEAEASDGEVDEFDVPGLGEKAYDPEHVDRIIRTELAKLEKAPKGRINDALNGAALYLFHFAPEFIGDKGLAGRLIKAQERAWLASGGRDDKDYRAARKTIISARTKAKSEWTAVRRDEDEDDEAGRVGPEPSGDDDEADEETGPAAHRTEESKGAAFQDAKLAPVVAEGALKDRYLHSDAFGWMAYNKARGTWGMVSEKAPAEAVRAYVVRRYAAAARELARRVAADDEKGAEKAEGWMDGWRKAMSASRLASLVKLCRGIDRVTAADDSFDADHTRLWLNTPTGVIDLETGTMRDHDPADRITTCTRVAPADAPSAAFSAFLSRVLPDPGVRDYVQRWFGSGLLGLVRDHILMVFDGRGRNGKGVLRSAVLHALGDYACEVSPELVMMQQHTQHRTFLMRLRARRVVCTSETEEGRKLNITVVKRLTGGDPIEANLMHHDPVEFVPYHSLTLMTNHLPEVSGADPALWERMRRVEFGVVIPEAERDVLLGEKLQDEAAGILRWMLDGLEAYRRDGLGIAATPPSVLMSTTAYREEGDLIARFLAERTRASRGELVGSRVLYHAYQAYVVDAGERPLTETAFGRDMGKRGEAARQTSKGKFYRRELLEPASDEEFEELR